MGAISRMIKFMHAQYHHAVISNNRVRFGPKIIHKKKRFHKRTVQTNLIWLHRWLGWRSLLRTTRWWSSRFDQREAHELTNPHGEALRYGGQAREHTRRNNTEQTNYGKGEPAQVTRWLHAPDIPRLNLSAPRLWESGKQLPAYNKKKKKKQASNARERGNPRVSECTLQLWHQAIICRMGINR